MHLDQDRIQRLIHREIPSEEEALARAHLDACPACTRAVEMAEQEEQELFGLLRQLDHPAPKPTAAEILGPVERGRASWIRWAAGIIGILGVSTAAYAAPGSPVPGWVREAAGRLGSDSPPAGPLTAEAVQSGVSVAPGAKLVVVFSSAEPSMRIEASLEDLDELVVEAEGGSPIFTSDQALLLVEGLEGAAVYRVRIPTSAPLVEIRLGERLLLRKVGAEITTDALRDEGGRYLLHPSGGEPLS